MIISIHIPKTAGQSFRLRLQDTFAPRALFDYGDLVGLDTPEAFAQIERRKLEMRARGDELLCNYDIIHGHFIADKYVGLFPVVEFAAFFRDPYQQAVSHYQFFLRHPEIDHPAVRLFHERHMTLPEFVATFPRIQSRFLGQISINDLAMVGLMEHYEQGVALFGAAFGRTLCPEKARENVNPNRSGDTYAIDATVRKAVETHSPGDVELYRRACEKFEQLRFHYGL